MRTVPAIVLLAFLGSLAACDSCGSSAQPIDAPTVDAPTDGPPIDADCPARAPGQVGGPCNSDAMCDSAVGAGDGFCLRGPQGATTWPAAGYCINRYDGCSNDASCGASNACVTINDPTGPFRACLPACGADPCVCSNGQICAASFAGSPLAGGRMACLPGNASATDGAACTGFGECAQDSMCLSDPLEYPGGQCHRLGCTLASDTTCAAGGDGHCLDYRLITAGLNPGNVCVDACAGDGDCRQADGYRCFDGAGAVGRFCRHPHAGDACAIDADCGNPAQWDCKLGLTFPGGLCTPTTGCPTPGSGQGCSPGSSICYDSVLPAVVTDNVCVDRCGGPIGTLGGCRAGYTCRDTNPGAGVVLGCVNP